MTEKSIYEGEIYPSWLKNVDERAILEEALCDRIDEWFDEKWKEKKILIADIGCGTGGAALRLFKILDKKEVDYSYLGVDPYKKQLERFRQSISLGDNRKLLCLRLEDFNPRNKFDIALVVHNLYYVSDMESSLRKITKFAKKTIIVHHGERGINEVHQKFKGYIRRGRHIISTHKDVMRALEKMGVDYESKVYSATVNVAPCKNPRDKDGRNMIKFFLERSDLSEDIISEVSNWFKEAEGDIMTHDFSLIITK